MMNAIKTFACAAIAVIPALTAAAQTFEDDIYYSAPSKKTLTVSSGSITYTPAQLPAGARTSAASSATTDYPAADSYQAVSEAAEGREIDIDEYNRRGFFATDSAYAASVPVYEQVASQVYYYPEATDVTIDADGGTVVTSGDININVNGYPSSYYWGNPYYDAWYGSWYYPSAWSFYWGLSPWYWGPSWNWSWSWGGYWPAYRPAYRPSPIYNRPGMAHRPAQGRPGGAVRPGSVRPGGASAVRPGSVGRPAGTLGNRPGSVGSRPSVGGPNVPGRSSASSLSRPAGSSTPSTRPAGTSSSERPSGSSSTYSAPSRSSSSGSSYSRPSSSGSSRSSGSSYSGGSRGGGGRH